MSAASLSTSSAPIAAQRVSGAAGRGLVRRAVREMLGPELAALAREQLGALE